MDRFNPERLTAQANVAMVVNPEGKYVRWADAEEEIQRWRNAADLMTALKQNLEQRIADLELLRQLLVVRREWETKRADAAEDKVRQQAMQYLSERSCSSWQG